MTRHAKNSTAGSVYTYHEKQKDARMSQYGSERARLGKESVTNFDCCNLSLQPARKPVITKDGYLYDKESILQYIITKKTEYSRKLKEFERQKDSDVKELERIADDDNKKKIDKFMKTEKNIKTPTPSTSSSSTSTLSNMAVGKEKLLPSFWLPSQTPDASRARIEKPDKNIYCPISGNILKAKDLIDVKFTPATVVDNSSDPNEHRYVCAVTKDVLTNAQQLAVLRTSGDVVTMDCVEKIIKKDWIHPLTSTKLVEKDIIMLQRAGTGFASANTLEAKTTRPALQC